MSILEAAKYDPLRAQEIESGLSQVWWQRYQVYQHEAAKVANEQQKKIDRSMRRR